MVDRSPLLERFKLVQSAIDERMQHLLPHENPDLPENPLFQAMRYAVMGGGKRLRPFLVIETAQLFSVPMDHAVPAACALEFIHAFSLCHDDLPCMDNADMRRGKPSTHIKFGESTAVLAGDSLLALAFEVLSHPDTCLDPIVRAEMVLATAHYSGPLGMCGGQMMDLATEDQDLDMSTIIRLQRLKTGRLLDACCTVGAVLGQASAEDRQALLGYSHDLGLVYQITDDLLDLQASVEEVGKPVQTDALLGKANLVRLLGADQAQEHAHVLTHQAISHLEHFGDKAHYLAELARYILNRRS